MTDGEFNLIELATKLIPIIIVIAQAILNRLRPEQRDPQIDAAIALLNALVAYIDQVTP